MLNSFVEEVKALSELQKEMGMWGVIRHPNIVRCLGATQHEGHINIFMEWMAGRGVCGRMMCHVTCAVVARWKFGGAAS